MQGRYHRDRFTWAAFVALSAFGLLNAVLGPALPYLRSEEDISYLVGALHQVAFAVGGGLAGLLAARALVPAERQAVIAAGLGGAGLVGLLLGYANLAAATIAAALVLSLLATSALIAIWAGLADAHGERRAVAMTEGEVAVSLAGILTPALISGLAATALSWRFAFVVTAAWAVTTAAIMVRVAVPRARAARPWPGTQEAEGPEAGAAEAGTRPRPKRRLQPTLLLALAVVALEFSLSFWLASYLEDDVGLPRDAAVIAVSGLYLANLLGRLLASRLVRHAGAELVLAGSLGVVLAGMPFLLAAEGALAVGVGIALAGAGIGATFPLASSLHIEVSRRDADGALGQTLATVSIGQLAGPLCVGAIAQLASLRAGFMILPAVTLLAVVALASTQARGGRKAQPA